MLDNKRALDRDMHIYEALFSRRLMERYQEFMMVCFVINRGVGRTAVLRANLKALKKNWRKDWNESWNDFFDNDTSADALKVEVSYRNLMDAFGAEVGITHWRFPKGIKLRLPYYLSSRFWNVQSHPMGSRVASGHAPIHVHAEAEGGDESRIPIPPELAKKIENRKASRLRRIMSNWSNR